MAAGDNEPPAKSDDESPTLPKTDVRVTSHDDMGVHVSRDLRAEGPSARGWSSNMSKLNFSARALPRDESAAGEAAPTPAAAAPVEASTSGESSPATPVTSADPVGPLSWLTGLFSRR
jgi:hypothetical protein